MSFHEHKRKYEIALKSMKNSSISKRNKELIEEFVNDLMLENLSVPRLKKYCSNLKRICDFMQIDLDKAKKVDVKRTVATIQQADYSPWTRRDFRIVLRRFYKWLHQSKELPEIVSWISIGIKRSEMSLPSEGDLLTEENIQTLLNNCKNSRDRALISILWESGARVGEIGNLKIKHVSFDNHGVVISVRGKTGSRKIRLISSTPFISTWLSVHPKKNDNESPVWVHLRARKGVYKQMNYHCTRMFLKKLFRRAGISKKSNPHLFRHSRATFMASHLTEFQMNQYFGWIQGSGMPATYVHMSGKNVDNAILNMNGIKQDEEKREVKMTPRICPRCDTINSYDSRHCSKCGGVVDLKAAMEMQEHEQKREQMRKTSDDLMAVLLKDNQVQEILKQKLQELGVKGAIF